jgi:hypothetical protein
MGQLKSIKVPAGYACLSVSLFLYGASYIFMFAGFGLLGREIVDKLKGKWKSFRSRDSSIESGKINNG